MCPRCKGMVLRDQAGDASCAACGWVRYDARELEMGQRFQAWDNTRGARARMGSLPNYHLEGTWWSD
jgi:uncharacterized Zn finger protein (UPF0148 family)